MGAFLETSNQIHLSKLPFQKKLTYKPFSNLSISYILLKIQQHTIHKMEEPIILTVVLSEFSHDLLKPHLISYLFLLKKQKEILSSLNNLSVLNILKLLSRLLIFKNQSKISYLCYL